MDDLLLNLMSMPGGIVNGYTERWMKSEHSTYNKNPFTAAIKKSTVFHLPFKTVIKMTELGPENKTKNPKVD